MLSELRVLSYFFSLHIVDILVLLMVVILMRNRFVRLIHEDVNSWGGEPLWRISPSGRACAVTYSLFYYQPVLGMLCDMDTCGD